MSEWWTMAGETLWRNAVGFVPLALLIAGLARFFPGRPAARHTLWLTALLWLITPPLLPSLTMPEVEPQLAETIDSERTRNSDRVVHRESGTAQSKKIHDNQGQSHSAAPDPTTTIEGRQASQVSSLKFEISDLRSQSEEMSPRRESLRSPPPTWYPESRTTSVAQSPRTASGASIRRKRFAERALIAQPTRESVGDIDVSAPAPIDWMVRKSSNPTEAKVGARSVTGVPRNARAAIPRGEVEACWIADAAVRTPVSLEACPADYAISHAWNRRAVELPRETVALRDDECGNDSEWSPPSSMVSAWVSPASVVGSGGEGMRNERSAVTVDRLESRSHIGGPHIERSPSDRVLTGGSSIGLEETSSSWAEWVAAVINVRDAAGAVPPLPGRLWVGGAGVLALIAAIRLLHFRLRMKNMRPADREVGEMIAGAARSMGMRTAPTAWMVDGRVSPMIWCGLKPRLILPSPLWEQLDDVGRRVVIFHELAHLRRKDHLVSWADIVIGFVFWWHPVVWWARNRLHAEAENCCDAWVTTLLPRMRRAYAEALLKTREFVSEGNRPLPVAGIGVTTGRARRFARRIAMVMTESTRPKLSVGGLLVAIVVANAGWLAAPARSCPPKDEADKSAAGATATPAPPCSSSVASAPSGASAKQAGSGATTFERYLETKSTAGEPTGTVVAMHHDVQIAPVVGVLGVPPPARLVGDDDEDEDEDDGDEDEDEVDARMEEFARRLQEVSEQLERLHEELGQGRMPRGPRAARAPRTPRAPQTPRAAHPPHPPMPPIPPMPSVPPGHHFPGPGQRWSDVNGEEAVWRTYKLPKGKLVAFCDLMARSDVPILVRSKPEGIELQASERQHAIICAFLQIIDPCGERAQGMLPPGAFAFGGPVGSGLMGQGPGCLMKDCPMCGKAAEFKAKAAEYKAKAREELDGLRERTRGEVERIRSRAREEAERVRERMRAHAREARTQAESHEDMTEALERQADAMREQAEEIRQQAERIRERAERVRERAAGNGEGEDSPRPGFEEHLRTMAESVDAMTQQASSLQEQAEVLSENARGLGGQVHGLHEHADHLDERAEAVEEATRFLDEEVDAGPELAEALIALASNVEQYTQPVVAQALEGIEEMMESISGRYGDVSGEVEESIEAEIAELEAERDSADEERDDSAGHIEIHMDDDDHADQGRDDNHGHGGAHDGADEDHGDHVPEP